MLATLLIPAAILLVCMALLSIKILLKKGGEFPPTHIDSSAALRERGIHCVRTQDYQQRHSKTLSERTSKK